MAYLENAVLIRDSDSVDWNRSRDEASTVNSFLLRQAANHPMHPSRRVGRFDNGESLAATG